MAGSHSRTVLEYLDDGTYPELLRPSLAEAAATGKGTQRQLLQAADSMWEKLSSSEGCRIELEEAERECDRLRRIVRMVEWSLKDGGEGESHGR